MNLLDAVIVVAVFAVLIHLFGIIKYSLEVISTSKESANALRDSSLEDYLKEKILQRKAIRLFVLFGILLLGSITALTVPIALIWILDAIGIFSFTDVLQILQRWDFLITATVLGIFAYLIIKKLTN